MNLRLNFKALAIQSFAELIGTAMYLYVAVGGADVVSMESRNGVSIVGESLAFGVGLMIVAWAFFRISGSHFNPSITLSSLITGHISPIKAGFYFIAQLLGGMLGVALTRGTTPSREHVGQVNQLMNGESIARGFFLEFFLTAILCFVYHMVVYEKNRSTFMAALPYGFTVFACHLFATRYTYAALNPARALATSVVARDFSRQHWVFWFGPLCGAVLASGLHILFRYLDFDHYNPGFDAENQAQYMRAQAAYDPNYSGTYPAATTTVGPNSNLTNRQYVNQDPYSAAPKTTIMNAPDA
ncbi:hypothetical protein BGW38_005823 [Lunasporangiospora selenospora]|uniref:Aquaporin Z n=1 Tax=Lunasporangiospora selenospora TaxID=979761 RepID=A0A9P6KIW8_9FUNG|nr:hypothetical protein BGW38_005823 [Lunasporangiospora selenospora]